MILFIAFVVIVALLIVLVARQPANTTVTFPYRKREFLCSPAERSFLGVLDRAVGDHLRVFAKVRVADVIATHHSLNGSARTRAFNRIAQKHFDFVLCRPTDLAVVCVVELDDKSHRRANRSKRDAFVDEACRVSGVPVIRVPARASYSTHDISKAIAHATSPAGESGEAESAAQRLAS